MANCGNLSVIDLTGCFKDNSGSISEIYITFKENVTGSTTVSTGNTLLIETIPATKCFYKFKPSRYSSNWTETTPDNEMNTVFEQTLTCVFPKRSGELAYQMKILAQGLCLAIVKDGNGKYWLCGENNGLSAMPAYDSGKALTDANAFTLVLKGVEPEPAYEVSASIISALVNMT